MARVKLSPLLTEVNGSVGASTFQRSLGGISLRSKPRGSSNFSNSRTQSKVIASIVISGWQSLTEAQRLEWNQFAEYNPTYMRRNKTRRLNGFNVFCKYNLIRLQAGLSILSDATFLAPFQIEISPEIYTVDECFFVGVGQGTNTLAYSSDGVNWTGIGTSIFTTLATCVCWSGSKYVATGTGTNTLAYSSDGVNWTGIGTSVFSDNGYFVCWNGSKFVAVGKGTNTIAYSSDGVNWTGIGTSIFTTAGRGVCWNGSLFIATGEGTNTIAYSSDGVNWTGLGTSIFSTIARGVCWGFDKFIAMGTGGNSIAYSSDGVNWTGIGTSIFTTAGRGVCWDGSKFIAGGEGTNTIAYSSDGVNWTGLGASIFSTYCSWIAWNGSKFVAVGVGTNTIAYSFNGINWTVLGTSTFSFGGYGICSLSAPSLVPVINHQLIFDLNANLYDEDQFLLLKLSNVRKPSESFRSNLCRVIQLTDSDTEYWDVTDEYYALFHTNPFSGSIVNVEVTMFSKTTGKTFPVLQTQIEISAT